jgi:hypothetical protein
MITLDDLNLTSKESQRYGAMNSNQLAFESTKEGYKQILFIGDFKKNKVKYAVRLIKSTNRNSELEKEIMCESIPEAIDHFNKIDNLEG